MHYIWTKLFYFVWLGHQDHVLIIEESIIADETPSAFIRQISLKRLPKAQRTRGLSSAHQSNFFRSYHKFSNKSWLDFIFIISTKQQLQNISQISAFRLILNFKILTKRSLRISTKNNLHNLNQGSAATSASKSCLRTSKFWPNLVLEVWTKNDFMTKLQLPNLHQTIVNTFLSSTSATVATSTSFELASSHARVTSIKFTKQQWVSQSVSYWVTDKHNQWSDSGPIKRGKCTFTLLNIIANKGY